MRDTEVTLGLRKGLPVLSYQRIDLAREQLDVALEIFLSHRSHVSALTLAGAAEEIFGKSLALRGEKTTLQHKHSIIAPVEELFQHKRYNWKEFITEENRVRNAVKHMKDETEATVVADIEDEALWLIVRACDNYRGLGLEPTSLMLEFDNWFFENVVDLEY